MTQKILLSTLMLLFGFNAMTQDLTKPPMGPYSIGIYGGVNFQNINGKDASGSTLENSLTTKFNFGINQEIPVAPEFFIQIGLQYIGKGATENLMYNSKPLTRKVGINYIEMPINFLYKPLVGKGHVLFGFGPYVGYGFMGKAKITSDNYNGDQNIKFANTVSLADPNNPTTGVYFKRLDVGANIFVGYEFANNITLTFTSQLGLININPKNNTLPNSKIANKNTGFGLTLGYRF